MPHQQDARLERSGREKAAADIPDIDLLVRAQVQDLIEILRIVQRGGPLKFTLFDIAGGEAQLIALVLHRTNILQDAGISRRLRNALIQQQVGGLL